MSALAILALVEPALAWKHNSVVWRADEIPVVWYMDDDPEDSLPGEDLQVVLQESYDAWDIAECAHVSDLYSGTGDYGIETNDGVNAIYWDDPGDDCDPGVLAHTVNSPAGGTTQIAGQTYYYIADGDITFNNDVDWATFDQITSGNCNSEMPVNGVATHEMGHWYGLGHSCDDGELCNDELKRDATMFWQAQGACDVEGDTPNEDDITGLTALYGPSGSFDVQAGTSRSGGTPLDFCVELTSEQVILSADVNWGDGTDHGTLDELCHTYEKAGQFTVTVAMDLEDPICGSYPTSTSELAYVLACEPPKPEEGADGFFTMEPVEGLTWQTINRSDVSVYGCLDTIEWQVYRGTSDADIGEANLVDLNGDEAEGAGIGAWSPKISFPEPGDYVVMLNVGGPGGLTGSWVHVAVEEIKSEGGGCGCDAGSGLASLAGVLVAAASAARRRRG
jgi:hypothetical protein